MHNDCFACRAQGKHQGHAGLKRLWQRKKLEQRWPQRGPQWLPLWWQVSWNKANWTGTMSHCSGLYLCFEGSSKVVFLALGCVIFQHTYGGKASARPRAQVTLQSEAFLWDAHEFYNMSPQVETPISCDHSDVLHLLPPEDIQRCGFINIAKFQRNPAHFVSNPHVLRPGWTFYAYCMDEEWSYVKICEEKLWSVHVIFTDVSRLNHVKTKEVRINYVINVEHDPSMIIALFICNSLVIYVSIT